MSALSSIIGIDVGGVIGVALPAALEVFSQNTSLRIAELNLQAAASAAAAENAGEKSNENQTRLLITGGLVLFGVVLATKALRGN